MDPSDLPTPPRADASGGGSAPTVIVLAAGRAERFRASGGIGHKLDARLGGRSVLEHVLQAVAASGLRWHLVRPAGGTAGMGDSIARGVQETPSAAGWLVLPGDLPLVRPDSIQRVAAALRNWAVVVPAYRGTAGHPVGFGRACRGALAALEGDRGAAAVVRHHRGLAGVCDLPLDDIGIVTDVDTVDDLQHAERLLAHRG